MVTLCPLCATENVKLILSHEGTPSLGAEGRSIDGRMLAFACEHGHIFLRVNAANDPSNLSSWGLDILAGKMDRNVAANKWFGMSCTRVQEHDDCHPWTFAVALEAISNAVREINEVVARVWEHSIGEIRTEAIADTGTDGSSVRKAKQNENVDCNTCRYGLSKRKQDPECDSAS